MKRFVSYFTLVMLLSTTDIMAQGTDSDTYTSQFYAEQCDRTDSVCTTLMSTLRLTNDKNVLFCAVRPEYDYTNPQDRNRLPQNIFSFFCCKSVGDGCVKGYRVVFDRHYDATDPEMYMTTYGRRGPIAQIDSLAMDVHQSKSIKHNLALLSEYKPFVKYDEDVCDDVIYLRLWKNEQSYLYAYSMFWASIRSSYNTGMSRMERLIYSVKNMFPPVKLPHIYRKKINVYSGSELPYIDADDDGFYSTDYGNALVRIAKESKSYFHHPLNEADSRTKTNEAFSFFNRLLVAVRNKGIDLESDYDMRYINYIHADDLYSIATTKDSMLHRTLVNIRKDGSIAVVSDTRSKLVYKSLDLTRGIKDLMNTVDNNIYCYSLDESRSLMELRYGGRTTVSIIGLGYCEVSGITQFHGIRILDQTIDQHSGTRQRHTMIWPDLKKTPLLHMRKIEKYFIVTADGIISHIGPNGNIPGMNSQKEK